METVHLWKTQMANFIWLMKKQNQMHQKFWIGDSKILPLWTYQGMKGNSMKTLAQYPTIAKIILYASVTLKDSTLGESSPDNLDEVDSAEIAHGAKQTESQESKGPNISRKLKKDLSHDSTVRKSYRAGIFGTMGSNSSLDKDIQQEIGREPLSETGISDTVKRKLGFGKNSNKNGPSTGKKVFGNFLTVPGKKPLQVSCFTDTFLHLFQNNYIYPFKFIITLVSIIQIL